MDAFTEDGIETVVLFTSARIGKTSIFNNVIGYHINQDPCAILMVQPTVEDAQDWSKDELTPMLRDTPALDGVIKEARSKDSSNTILHKNFAGGFLKAVGANSARGFRRTTIRILLADEVDGYPPSAGSEGDPLALARKRTATVWNRKIGIASTPTIRDISRIEHEWNQSDQRHYYVPCPHCGHFQILIFWHKSQFAHLAKGYLEFDKENPLTAQYVCEKCAGRIDESQKNHMISLGEWRKTRPHIHHTAGFHLNELYSPFVKWVDTAKAWVSSYKRLETRRVFINTCLGETYEDTDAVTISEEVLMERRERYGPPNTPWMVPAQVLQLTAAVDVQADRLECLVQGWGKEEENWLITHRVFYGIPTSRPVWAELDQFLLTSFLHESGLTMQLSVVFIDSGHLAHDVAAFTKPRIGRRIYAVKGFGGPGRPLIGKPGRTGRVNALQFPIGVDDAKEKIYNRIQNEKHGPTYMHFNQEADASYFLQLMAEKPVIEYIKGAPRRRWVRKKDGLPNEILDLTVYNLAAYWFTNPTDAKHQEIEKLIKEKALERSKQPAGTVNTPASIGATETKQRKVVFVDRGQKW